MHKMERKFLNNSFVAHRYVAIGNGRKTVGNSRAWLYHADWHSKICVAEQWLNRWLFVPIFMTVKFTLIHYNGTYDWAESYRPLYCIEFNRNKLHTKLPRAVSIRSEGKCGGKYFERAHNCRFDCFIGAAAVRKFTTRKKNGRNTIEALIAAC